MKLYNVLQHFRTCWKRIKRLKPANICIFGFKQREAANCSNCFFRIDRTLTENVFPIFVRLKHLWGWNLGTQTFFRRKPNTSFWLCYGTSFTALGDTTKSTNTRTFWRSYLIQDVRRVVISLCPNILHTQRKKTFFCNQQRARSSRHTTTGAETCCLFRTGRMFFMIFLKVFMQASLATPPWISDVMCPLIFQPSLMIFTKATRKRARCGRPSDTPSNTWPRLFIFKLTTRPERGSFFKLPNHI